MRKSTVLMAILLMICTNGFSQDLLKFEEFLKDQREQIETDLIIISNESRRYLPKIERAIIEDGNEGDKKILKRAWAVKNISDSIFNFLSDFENLIEKELKDRNGLKVELYYLDTEIISKIVSKHELKFNSLNIKLDNYIDDIIKDYSGKKEFNFRYIAYAHDNELKEITRDARQRLKSNIFLKLKFMGITPNEAICQIRKYKRLVRRYERESIEWHASKVIP